MTLSDTADGRITGHLCDPLSPQGYKNSTYPKARTRCRRLNSGMTATNYNNSTHIRLL
jgi:hypothetical protein